MNDFVEWLNGLNAWEFGALALAVLMLVVDR